MTSGHIFLWRIRRYALLPAFWAKGIVTISTEWRWEPSTTATNANLRVRFLDFCWTVLSIKAMPFIFRFQRWQWQLYKYERIRPLVGLLLNIWSQATILFAQKSRRVFSAAFLEPPYFCCYSELLAASTNCSNTSSLSSSISSTASNCSSFPDSFKKNKP